MENKPKSTFRKLVFQFDAHDYEDDIRNDAPSAPSARQRLTSTPKKKSWSVYPFVDELVDLEESSEDVFQESCNIGVRCRNLQTCFHSTSLLEISKIQIAVK